MATRDRRKKKKQARGSAADNVFFVLLVALVCLLLVVIAAGLLSENRRKEWSGYLKSDRLFVTTPSESETKEEGGPKRRIAKPEASSSSAVEDRLSEAEDFQTLYQNLPAHLRDRVNPSFDFSALHSSACGVYDVGTHQFLLGRHLRDRLAPASLTKIMTAFLAIEKEANLNKLVEMKQDIFDWIYGQDLSVAGFVKGEKARVLDLLYGAMLPSGADACLGLAQAVSGGQEAFVAEMNRRAGELGLKDTHFVNCVGNDDEEQYSTVYDLTKLTEIAMRNKVFQMVSSAETYTVPANRVRKEELKLFSTVTETISQSYGVPNGVKLLGGKTGYTEKARLCLIVMLQKRDHIYIICAMDAEGQNGAAEDCMRLADLFLR